jgi:membrane protease YdiL (CAAX protease family)
VALLPITLLGMLFAFLTRRSQSLLASAGAHAAYNGMITAVVLLISWALNGPGS